MFECMHCLHKTVVWDNDFNFEDYGLIGDGIVHACHCTNCGAEITYYISLEDEEEK